MNSDMKSPGNPRAMLWLIALAYTVFVIYGSLVPLEFQALQWDEAVARFGSIPFLKLGIGSRADWVANLLLFIPLTYLWMGALTGSGGRLNQLFATLALVPAATALSVGIEFTQMFFPQRTVSQNDIFAETLGGIIGVLAWWPTGGRFTDWLRSWWHTHTRAALAERLAWTYLAGVVFYNVLPLDLTISLVEVFHKWRSGMVNLVPFGRLPDDAAYALYEVATDALIWTPLALLWRLDGTRRAARAWGMTLATAVTLEVMQLFVYSRVSDVTDIFTAALGAALGSWAGGRLTARDASVHSSWPWANWLPFGLASAWLVCLLFVFWFPFDFRVESAFVQSRLGSLSRLPFEVYYFGTEFRAATEALHKTLFFAPLGGLLAWGVARQAWRWRAPLFALSMLVLLLTPACVELGQLMLPGKVVDTTDWLLAWLGGLAGYGVSRRLLRAPRIARPARVEAQKAAAPPRPSWSGWHLLWTVGAMTLLIRGLAQADFMPYNVRELLRPEQAWFSAMLLALAVYWLAAYPVWLARRPASGGVRLWQLPVGLLAYGGLAYLLLDAAVPDESLFDLAGSPVLDWPGRWEIGLRWVALLAAPGALLYLAAQSVRLWRGKRLGALHFLAAAPVLALSYWAIIVKAATDNLTELIATPQSLAFVSLCAGLYVAFLAAALLASPPAKGQRAMRPLTVGLSLPLAGLLFGAGLAGDIDKYGQHFSAWQFLLSADRQHYASQTAVWLRYGVLHALVIVTLASLQWPYFRSAERRTRPAPTHDLL